MPKQIPEKIFSYVGIVAWGDIGAITMYRSQRGKIIWFSKTWPDKPASLLQQAQRDRMSVAAGLWQLLSQWQKGQWELCTHRASLCMNGYQLFQHWRLTQDESAIRTLERQTDTILLPITPIESSSSSCSSLASSSSHSSSTTPM